MELVSSVYAGQNNALFVELALATVKLLSVQEEVKDVIEEGLIPLQELALLIALLHVSVDCSE